MKLLLEFFSYLLIVVIVAISEKLMADTIKLPLPNLKHKAITPARVIDWKPGITPTAPAGFQVTKFADGFKSSRWIYVAPNGDILVAESQADRITLLRDANKDGKPEVREIFLENLNKPFGMLVLKNYFYVANTDSIMRYSYKSGDLKLLAKGEKILDLPGGGHHWTRNILAGKKVDKIYVTVGSASNIAEYGIDKEKRRANILEINPDGSAERIYASGLRNPVGMDWNPDSGKLWTAVNERDFLGDDLVPDYITEVEPGGFYGWPYAYWGKNADPRLKGERHDLIQKSLVPSVSLGAHTASLGLVFYPDKTGEKYFPARYQKGAFVGQHGSWNRSSLVGYKVVFVPFKAGKSNGPPEDFLSGFIADREKSEVYGRPVGVAVLSDGSLLVADDASNILWKVTYTK